MSANSENLLSALDIIESLRAERDALRKMLSDHDCKARETGDLCGGCCACLEKQASYAIQCERERADKAESERDALRAEVERLQHNYDQCDCDREALRASVQAPTADKKCECANPRSATGTLCWDCGRPLRAALASTPQTQERENP